ncbi:hypothetical protein GCM10008020_42560 [Massilia psychrophila]|nr:hypothetical protein GCM10008020_42560 [Massilia psychrophila]
MWSDPWVRAVATRSARPALASQAEKASSSIGAVDKLIDSVFKVQRAMEINKDNIMPSKHNNADRR